MTLNWQVCAIWCRQEIARKVLASSNMKITNGQMAVNFEVASTSSLRDFQKGVDVISSQDVDPPDPAGGPGHDLKLPTLNDFSSASRR